MKILRKLSEEKGSITMTVVAAMLFITSAVLIAYFSLSNQSNDQSKKTKQVADSYKVTNTDLVQKYKDVQDNFNEVTTMSIAEVKSLGNTMLAKGTNTVVNDELGNNFVVPAGFKVTDDANNVTQGMVIQDESGNEFVWVPVSDEDLALMVEESSAGWNMLGTNVNTKYKTPSVTIGTKEFERLNPGLQRHREPDLLSSNDSDETNYTQAGFSDLSDMATKLKDDYKDMINSIKNNSGFYVGRYELGKDSDNNPQVKAGFIKNYESWYSLYLECKEFGNENVESRMIWGNQWDQICRFIKAYGNKVNLDDSRTYGNYTNSEGAALTNSGSSVWNNTTGIRNEVWKINNMYDLAGNCWEWTQEASYSVSRAIRGGCYYANGQDYSVLARSNLNCTDLNSGVSTRPVLYIK